MTKLAVVKTGGKQYVVKSGDKITVEKIEAKDGKKVDFKDVLLVSDADGKNFEIGTPTLKNKVSGTVSDQIRERKISVIKYKAKTRYRRKLGHRQEKTLIKIDSIA